MDGIRRCILYGCEVVVLLLVLLVCACGERSGGRTDEDSVTRRIPKGEPPEGLREWSKDFIAGGESSQRGKSAKPVLQLPAAEALSQVLDETSSKRFEGATDYFPPIQRSGDGKVSRVRVLRTSHKYPLIRSEEEFRFDPERESYVLAKEQFSIADHIIVQFDPSLSAGEVTKRLKAGWKIRRKLIGRGSYLIQFPIESEKSLADAVQTMSTVHGVEYAEADSIYFAD